MVIMVFPGKGGTGKTTLSALTVRYFAEKGEISLALDFDTDSHLHKLLGLPVRKTVGQVVDQLHKEKKAELEPKKPIDVSDHEYFLSLIAKEVFVEGSKFDILTLGRPSIDIDCYCPVFIWAEYAISQIMRSYGMPYKHIIVDCDPGTEIFPRKILDHIAQHHRIDYILVVLDGSRMSLDTAKNIVDEIEKRKLKTGKIFGVCNRVDDENLQKVVAEVARKDYEIEIIGFIPSDVEVAKIGITGQSIMNLSFNSPAYKALRNIMSALHV
ncbi:MAG: nucleotide-binding protein [Candidatus Bathyarchaeota archaeon]